MDPRQCKQNQWQKAQAVAFHQKRNLLNSTAFRLHLLTQVGEGGGGHAIEVVESMSMPLCPSIASLRTLSPQTSPQCLRSPSPRAPTPPNTHSPSPVLGQSPRPLQCCTAASAPTWPSGHSQNTPQTPCRACAMHRAECSARGAGWACIGRRTNVAAKRPGGRLVAPPHVHGALPESHPLPWLALGGLTASPTHGWKVLATRAMWRGAQEGEKCKSRKL